MDFNLRLPFKFLLGILFGLLVIAIGVLGVLTFQNNNNSMDTSFLVNHSQKVIDKVEGIASLCKDIQLESIAFLIYSDSTIIPVYNHAKKGLLDNLKETRIITRENPDLQVRMDSLESFLVELIAFNDQVFLNSGGNADPGIGERIKNNKFLRAKIRGITQQIIAEERELLEVRESNNQEHIKAFNRTFFLLLSSLVILLITTFLSVRNNFKKRVRAQREMKHAKDLFSKLFRESPIGMAMTRLSDGVILDCNTAYAELINYSREEIIGNTAGMLQINYGNDDYNQQINAARAGKVVKDVEVQLKPKGKEFIWASVSLQSINVQKQPCLLSAVLDMTVHKRAEEEIKKALAAEINLNKMKSNFVTLASHEFRTPLSTILTSAFLLENYAYGENQAMVSKYLGRINSSVKDLTGILDEFLSLTKIEERKVGPKWEKINVKAYLENCIQELKILENPGQNMVYTHSGNSHFYTDAVLLGIILKNILSNAIKYSPRDSDILISSRINGFLHLSIKDHGIGIPPQDQVHLFKRFYRASNAGTVKGTGLGLHIMKHYADMLKGSIKIKSSLNKGSEFKIVFEDFSQEHSQKENNEGAEV